MDDDTHPKTHGRHAKKKPKESNRTKNKSKKDDHHSSCSDKMKYGASVHCHTDSEPFRDDTVDEDIEHGLDTSERETTKKPRHRSTKKQRDTRERVTCSSCFMSSRLIECAIMAIAIVFVVATVSLALYMDDGHSQKHTTVPYTDAVIDYGGSKTYQGKDQTTLDRRQQEPPGVHQKRSITAMITTAFFDEKRTGTQEIHLQRIPRIGTVPDVEPRSIVDVRGWCIVEYGGIDDSDAIKRMKKVNVPWMDDEGARHRHVEFQNERGEPQEDKNKSKLANKILHEWTVWFDVVSVGNLDSNGHSELGPPGDDLSSDEALVDDTNGVYIIVSSLPTTGSEYAATRTCTFEFDVMTNK